jgi:hypothetical protein
VSPVPHGLDWSDKKCVDESIILCQYDDAIIYNPHAAISHRREVPMETQVAAATPVQQDPALRTAAATRARLKHGMYSRHIVLPGEDRAEYEDLRADLLDDLGPDGETESKVVEHLVHAQWKLQRLWANETGVHVMHEEAFPQGDTPLPLRLAACGQWDAAGNRELERISRHQQRVFNQFYKALRELAVVRKQRQEGLLGEKPAAGTKPVSDSNHEGSGENLDRGAGTADAGSANCRADRDPPLQNDTASPGNAQVGARSLSDFPVMLPAYVSKGTQRKGAQG